MRSDDPIASHGSGVPVVVDRSWLAMGGIGRFASEVINRRPDWTLIDSRLAPTNPLSPFALGLSLRNHVDSRSGAVFFSPGYIPPLTRSFPFAITIHDLMYHRGHANFSPPRSLYLDAMRSVLARSRCLVFTVSRYSESQLRAWLPDHVEVRVVGNGVAVPSGAALWTRARAAGADGRARVLLVTSERPNKNLARQLYALQIAAKEVELTVRLVLPHQPSRHLQRLMSESNLHFETSVQVAEEALWDLYASSSLLLMASLEEGYGLPALEAMAVGCPLVASAVGGTAEFILGCGAEVDPFSVDGIAKGVLEALSMDPDVESRRALGVRRAKQQTWDSVVARIDAGLAVAADK